MATFLTLIFHKGAYEKLFAKGGGKVAKGPSKSMAQRTFFVLIVFVIIFFLPLIGRLAKLQILDYEFYQAKAVEQQTRDMTITPQRGTIYDRNMKKLAVSASVEQVLLNPASIKTDEQRSLIADKLSEILGVDREKVYAQTKKNNFYEIVKRGVEKDVATKVREFITQYKVPGVYLREDTKRYYPNANFASQVLGFVGSDNQGLSGIEAYYDKYLKGTPGRIITARNAAGAEMPFKYETYIDAKNGLGLVLTIDEVVQHFLEKHLETALVENKVQNKVAGIVMDVNTGEILAMATKPDFDLNQPFTITDPKVVEALSKLTGDEYKTRRSEELNKMWRNKPVVDAYEPGSTFKIITASIALEEKVVKLSDTFYCPGYKKVGGWTIRCWKSGGHGSETFVKGIQNSCNPVFMTVAERIGGPTFLKYFKAYGLTEKTGIDLPGEAVGISHSPENFSEVSLATYSFGQTFKITPIQLITAVSAVANGGKLMKPYVVKEMVDDDLNVKEVTSPTVIRQVISKETSEVERSLLESVVSEGTGKNAYVKGYRVAGKTGTSEKIDEKNKAGVADKRIASFVGFAPADNPKVAVLVLMDEPGGTEQFGGVIAAPVVGSIMADILPYLGVEQKFSVEEMLSMDVSLPNTVGKTVAQARQLLKMQGIKANIVGSGETVIKQVPVAGSKVPPESTVVLYTKEGQTKTTVVPDVAGMSAQSANTAITNAGLNIRVVGAQVKDSVAVAWKQNPAAGTRVDTGSVVSVEFRHLDSVE